MCPDKAVAWTHFQTASGRWIGVCDELGLTIQSETFIELLEDITSAIEAIRRDLAKDEAALTS